MYFFLICFEYYVACSFNFSDQDVEDIVLYCITIHCFLFESLCFLLSYTDFFSMKTVYPDVVIEVLFYFIVEQLKVHHIWMGQYSFFKQKQ